VTIPAIGDCLALFAAAALLKVSLNLADAPNNPIFIRVLCWIFSGAALLITAQVTVLWLTGTSLISAATDSRSENVIVKAIIVPELELRNVKMQVFLTDVVECADDAALEDAPEALNRVGVNRADNVLAGK
jgi:hypothetical protein